MQKINNWIKLYYWVTLLTFVILTLSSLLLLWYFENFSNLENTINLAIQAILMLITTFAGIFLPIQIGRIQKKRDDKRALLFTLTFIWKELILNKHILEQININYTFREIITSIPIIKNKITTVVGKYDSIYNQAKKLTNESYIAGQNSVVINALDDDDNFNDILFAYENLNHFKLNSMMVYSDIKLKKYLVEQTFDPLTVDMEDKIIDDITKKLIKLYAELQYTIKMVDNSINSLDDYLKKHNIKSSLVERTVEKLTILP